jgi:hypothetical protein
MITTTDPAVTIASSIAEVERALDSVSPSSDADAERLFLKLDSLEEELIETPSTSTMGVIAKLRRALDASESDPDDVDASLIVSAIADLEQMARANKAVPSTSPSTRPR